MSFCMTQQGEENPQGFSETNFKNAANGTTTAALVANDRALSSEQSSVAEFCWRDSYGRGAGEFKTLKCPEDFEMILGTCYRKCDDGFQRRALDCHAKCPGGYTDDGLFCRKGNDPFVNPKCDEHKHIGGPFFNSCAKHIRLGESVPPKCPDGLELNGFLCYKPCRNGYKGVGKNRTGLFFSSSQLVVKTCKDLVPSLFLSLSYSHTSLLCPT